MDRQTVTVAVPGVVYYDALDPLATDVPREEGWPEPSARRRGRGRQFVYELSPEQAESMADYLDDRAVGLMMGADPDPAYPKARKVAAAIREQVRRERLMRQAIEAPVVR